MKSFKIGLIRVITMTDKTMMEMHGNQIMDYYPQLKVESRCIPDQYEGIHSPETKSIAIPKIIELAKQFNNKDALIISCADDPAVKELNDCLDIPVIGAGMSVAGIARYYGPVSGVLGITDYAPPAYEEMFGKDLINLGRPKGVNGTLDLMTEAGEEAVMELAQKLKEKGAMSISLACTGMSTIGITNKLAKLTGLPVIDPVLASGARCLYECLSRQI